MNKSRLIKLLGLCGACVAAAGLALNGQYVEAVGVLAAAFSSTTAVIEENSAKER